MRDTYVQNVIKLSALEKVQINSFYNAALRASQQTFFESLQIDNTPVVELLEGSVKYSIDKELGVFYPNPKLKSLLESSTIKGKSVLLEKNMSRFTTILLHAYKDFHYTKETPYQIWLESGYSGTEEDFSNWVRGKIKNEKERK